MQLTFKKLVLVLIILAFIVLGIFTFTQMGKKPEVKEPAKIVETTKKPIYKVIGTSAQGRNIESYTYGTGAKKLLLVGGIHGGYEWNSVYLAYQFLDYFDQNSDVIPQNLTVTVIPDLNPDAVYVVTGKEGRFALDDVSTNAKVLTSARFNSNNVDLNRNFDCRWQPKSTWQSKTVSAGTSAFSEPESVVFRDYILENKPDAVVFWHSQAGGVYASQCKAGILPGTSDIMNAYSKASGYPAEKTFDAYATTGAADDWLASIDIPAVSVELKTHNTIEWDKNLAGVKALLNYFGN